MLRIDTRPEEMKDKVNKQKLTLADLPSLLHEVRGKPEEWILSEVPNSWFEEAYLFLRAEVGMKPKQCFYAAWLSVGKDDRGNMKTHSDVADLLAVNRGTLYDWRTKHGLDDWAEILRRMRMRGTQLAEVDKATYQAATRLDGKSTDRRLYYERAGVLGGDETDLDDKKAKDRSMQILVELKKHGEFEDR